MPASRFLTSLGFVVLLPACAGGPRADVDAGVGPGVEPPPLVIARAIHEMAEEFPGVQVSARRFVLSTQGRAPVSAPDSATARQALDHVVRHHRHRVAVG